MQRLLHEVAKQRLPNPLPSFRLHLYEFVGPPLTGRCGRLFLLGAGRVGCERAGIQKSPVLLAIRPTRRPTRRRLFAHCSIKAYEEGLPPPIHLSIVRREGGETLGLLRAFGLGLWISLVLGLPSKNWTAPKKHVVGRPGLLCVCVCVKVHLYI